MRIAQACFRFAAPGGAEEHVLQISRELVKRGHDVTVHTSDILTETPWTRGDWTGAAGSRQQAAGTTDGQKGRRDGDDGAERQKGRKAEWDDRRAERQKGRKAEGQQEQRPYPTPGTRHPAPEVIDGIEVIRHKAYIRPISERWSTLVIPDMLSGLLNEGCDLYHAHSHRYFQLEAAAGAARANGRPLVITPHYHPAERDETLRTRILLKLYDLYSSGSIYRHAGRVLTMTDLEKRFMASIVPAEKCSTVGAGIDPGEWEDVPSPGPFRNGTGIDGPYLLYSGRLATNKGLETLFEALPSIFNGFDGDMVLIGKDWGMKTALVGQARKGGFEKRVRFIDFLPDRALYKSALAGCEMLVLPSQWEAFGLVLLEAGMCRRPVVATAVGGVPEVVNHGRTGLLVPSGDPRSLSISIKDLLSDKERGAKMGEEARKLVLEKHTWPRVVDRVLKAYDVAMGDGGEA